MSNEETLKALCKNVSSIEGNNIECYVQKNTHYDTIKIGENVIIESNHTPPLNIEELFGAAIHKLAEEGISKTGNKIYIIIQDNGYDAFHYPPDEYYLSEEEANKDCLELNVRENGTKTKRYSYSVHEMTPKQKEI